MVLPALVLNYFGQGALLMVQPEAVTNPFYLLLPRWALLVLGIREAFMLTRQALVTPDL